MDTKLKKLKPVLSVIALFLAVSMLVTGAANFAGSVYYRGDILKSDYQDTRDFRNQISSYLEDFLRMATGGTLEGSYYYGSREDVILSAGEETGTGYAAASAVEEKPWFSRIFYNDFTVTTSMYEEVSGVFEGGASIDEKPDDPSYNLSRAKKLHEQLKNDKNILYDISYEGKILYTNAENGELSGGYASMPKEYNFLLYFDGKKATITKDGAELNVYGDGHYNEDSSDWYLPGYNNFTVDEKTSKAEVRIAAAKTPAIYLKGNYSGTDVNHSGNQLYWVAKNLEQRQNSYKLKLVMLAVGAVLMVIYIILRRSKKDGDKAIAKFTGRIWFEVKLFLLLLVLGVPLGILFFRDFQYIFMSGDYFFSYGMLHEAVINCVSNFRSFVVVFGVVYLFINDLRYNEKTWRNSITTKLARLLSDSDLKLPVHKRTMRQLRLVFIFSLSAVIYLLFSALATFVYEIGNDVLTSGTGFAAVGVLIAVLLFIALHCYTRRIKRLLCDTETLTEQIAAVRSGNLAQPLAMPDDTDLAACANDLNDIQCGMNTAMEEQIKSERMKVELIANVSHDIKTPLTSIISYVELLKQEEDLPEHIKDYVRILDSKSERLKTMVQDVFEVSKAASGQLPVASETLDLGKLLRQTLAGMDEQIQQSSVTLKVDITDEPVMIFADGDRLYRVFDNLLQNALKYSLEGSRVFVTLKNSGETAVATIKNISKQEIPNDVDFTERFVRGDQSREGGGSGLGLSIASSFTAACGGKFSVESIGDLFVATVEFAQAVVEP